MPGGDDLCPAREARERSIRAARTKTEGALHDGNSWSTIYIPFSAGCATKVSPVNKQPAAELECVVRFSDVYVGWKVGGQLSDSLVPWLV